MEHNANKRVIFGQTDLNIACKTGNVAIVRAILDWRDDDGKRVNISARDENGQTALSFAKQSNNAEIVAMIELDLFLGAVEYGETETVKSYLTLEELNFELLYRRVETDILNDHHENNSEQVEVQSHEDDLITKRPQRRFKSGIETEFTSKNSISGWVWLQAVAIAHGYRHDEMLNLLFNDDRFIYGFNEDGQTILHQVVAEYLEAINFRTLEKLDKIQILLKSGKFSANDLNLQNETIFEIVCKIRPKHCRQIQPNHKIDQLLPVLLHNRIDLNGRNKNGETFLMLACKNRRFDIVRSLFKVASRDFFLDIDAVDNSGETALMKAKRTKDSKIVAALLLKTLISAVEDERQNTMLNHFLLGLNEDEPTNCYEVVPEYLEVDMVSKNMKTFEIVLNYWTFIANVLNLQSDAIFEIICEIKREYYCKMDNLLQILFENGIDLNGRNENGVTFLMLACGQRRFNIVRSLIKLASREFVLDIDAIDNDGETALMIATVYNDSKTVAALLMAKLISSGKEGNEDIVKFWLNEVFNPLDIFEKSWNSEIYHESGWKEKEKKFEIWKDTMYIALEKDTEHAEDIVKLLLNSNAILTQEMFHQLMSSAKDVDDKMLRLIEILLNSENINANARDKTGKTALHLVEDEKLISLLIRYGADVNKKDSEGKTPLMPIFNNAGKIRFPVLQKLFKEAGTLVNLDAMDCNGRTALMHAVIMHRSHDVELLLNKGASVNLSDHLGFTALHHALHGNINEHLEFSRNSEELKKIKEMAILFDAQRPNEHRVWRNGDWSEERRKTVEMLLQRPDIDVNLLSIEMLSPLDIAEGWIPEIPSAIKDTKDALKEKGAVLNAFRQAEWQSTSEFHLDFACKLTLKQLVETVNALNNENVYFLKERWRTLIETFKEQSVSFKDQKGRTSLHLVVISFYIFSFLYSYGEWDFANTIVEHLISLGCSVNETDIFGRTPLHYADEILRKLLISKGADASIKDTDGNCVTDDTSWEYSTPASYTVRTATGQHEKTFFISEIIHEVTYGKHETYSLRLTNNKQMEINVQFADRYSDAKIWREEANLQTALKLLWEKYRYALRHPLVENITKDVRYVMHAIAKEIERLDPRFEIRVEFVGSSNEGTKIDEPDEFDVCFVLTKIGELCEVSQSPELSTGFVHLKRKPIRVDEESDFDSFFGKYGILNTAKLQRQFTAILRNALVNIDSQLSFEWILEMPLKYNRISDHIKKVLKIEMRKPLNYFLVEVISVDIVPCIHIEDWWPEEAISNVSDEIKKFGCNLVFDGPQELYPWVPYSEFCSRISFAKAESDMIKQSCDNAKEAYMIGKTMVKNWSDVSKYIMKICLLYCIEALSPSSEKASQLGLTPEELESKFHQMDRYLWLKCLLRCHLEFVAQDFCPCYFLPTFCNSSLIEKGINVPRNLKKVSFDWISDHSSTFPRACEYACALYRCTSNHISESSYQLPAPDPLWERFDRKQLIARLFEIAYK